MSSKSKSEGVFNVESISTERLFRGRAQYLVSWEGHDDVTWQYAHTIEHTPAFATYMRAKKKQIVSITESRTHEGDLQYRVSYPAMKDIWEPASFVKGTKALKAFRALQKSAAAELESVASSEEHTTSSSSISTSTPSIPSPSISTSAPPSVSPTARRVATITNHQFCNSNVEYLVTWTTGEQTWEHSEILNLNGGETATRAYITSIMVDVDPLTVLHSRQQTFVKLGTALQRLHPFLSSHPQAREKFRVCTSLWKLASMLSHQAFLMADREQNHSALLQLTSRIEEHKKANSTSKQPIPAPSTSESASSSASSSASPARTHS